MKKFKVEAIKDDDGLVIGIRAARVNDRDVIIALNDVPDKMKWEEAVKCNIPSLIEWLAIFENKDKVDKALKRAGGEPLGNDYYWSSSEYYTNYAAWVVRPSDGYMGGYYKNGNTYRVRCKM